MFNYTAASLTGRAIESALKRLSMPKKEIASLIDIIRRDGWRSYQTAYTEMNIIQHFRSVIRDLIDSIKLLPWTHRISANAKSVIVHLHLGVSKKHLQHYLSEVYYRINRDFGLNNHSTAC